MTILLHFLLLTCVMVHVFNYKNIVYLFYHKTVTLSICKEGKGFSSKILKILNKKIEIEKSKTHKNS